MTGAADLPVASGTFWRTVPLARRWRALAPPAPDAAGRYHRPGQPALYMSAEADWARIAVSGYAKVDGMARVLVPLTLDRARVVDQRDGDLCQRLGLDRDASNVPWRAPLARGETPPSWTIADRAREIGADGIIDRSRHIPGGWHLILFRWNAPGAPRLALLGEGIPARPPHPGEGWG